MLHFLSSLFATSSRRDDPVDKALIERATERVLEGSDPRLRALPGYAKRLRAPVETAVRHVIDLVGRLPEPAEISRQAFRNDPRLRAFFVSPEHLQETIAGCPMMNDYLRAAQPAAGDAIFGLLSMTRSEKNILGMDLQGDTLQRDVAQVAVNFSDHRYLGPSGDETETRRELMRRGFDFLIEKALQSIIAARSKKAELDQQRQLLQRKLRAMEAGKWGLDPVFAANEAGATDLVALEGEIQALETQLLALGTKPHALEHSLEHIAATLSDPAHWLDMRSISLELNPMSVKAGPGTTGRCYPLELTELFSASGQQRTVLLGRFPAQDLPPRPDFLEEAARWLG
jgi:hypothetical protein